MKKWSSALFLVSILLASSACDSSSSSLQGSSDIQQLRISNTGDEDIQDLIVLFPGATPAKTVRINFGDVPAGETTEYQSVSSGVYRYAAYEYTLDGETVHQPVMDWMGEEPLAGTQFTYQILLDKTRVQGDQIQLVEVLNESDS
jgi:hypothetical protein